MLRASSGKRCFRQSTSVEIRNCRYRLFASRTGVHINFHANRHFDDFWSLPSHFRSPFADFPSNGAIVSPKQG